MNNLEKTLMTNLGFPLTKTRIYLSLLALGEATASNIAKKAGIKRTTLYNILPELMAEGLISSTKKNKKTYFLVDDPKNLKTEIDDKAKNIEKVIPQLQELQSILPYKPKITFYEGLGGVKELYQDVIDSVKSGDEIWSIIGSLDLYELIPREIAYRYINARIKKKVVNKIITSDTKVSREWKESEAKELRQVKLVAKSKYDFQADMKIYANKVAFLSYKENFMGVIIESREINQLQKMAFEIAWESLV